MLDQDFCIYLEYEISKALGNSKEEGLNGFWCDGIIIDEPSPFHTNVSKRFYFHSISNIFPSYGT
jgi:hypothetical protein